ncbi:hypothetical protein [Nocardia sp. NPDC059229]|uniref:hypothetical protein n=1 Tax=Nocardia sp. NPDC059229 TaxID=3346778 RepID=UPI0036A1886A
MNAALRSYPSRGVLDRPRSRWADAAVFAAVTGLGAYIADATRDGDWPRILVGVLAMSAFVVGINRLFWRRLYALAQRRYSL